MKQKTVQLQDIVVFTGPEPDARRVAYDLVMQIREKHTYKDKARQAFVTASALAILRGGTDEFVPDNSEARKRCRHWHCRASQASWTVTIRDALASRKDVAA